MQFAPARPSWKRPLVQAEQLMLPSAPAKLPIGHAVQLMAAMAGWYRPLAHGKQIGIERRPLYVPREQIVQFLPALGLSCPSGHRVSMRLHPRMLLEMR